MVLSLSLFFCTDLDDAHSGSPETKMSFFFVFLAFLWSVMCGIDCKDSVDLTLRCLWIVCVGCIATGVKPDYVSYS